MGKLYILPNVLAVASEILNSLSQKCDMYSLYFEMIIEDLFGITLRFVIDDFVYLAYGPSDVVCCLFGFENEL